MGDRRFDVVFLDAGGVLVQPSPAQVGARFEAAGIAVDRGRFLAAHYHGVAALDRAAAAPDEFGDYHEAYAAHLGLTGPEAEAGAEILRDLWANSSLWDEALPWAAAGLAAIAATGVPIVIVSNADGSVAEILGRVGLLQVGPGPGVAVQAVIDSAAVGVAKPDPVIFEHALAAAGPGATADRAVHVGDAYQYDVAGARAAGVHPVLVDPLGIRTEVDCERVASLVDVAALLQG